MKKVLTLVTLIGLTIICFNVHASDSVDISGKWYSNIEYQYHIMQNGNTFSWVIVNKTTQEKGNGKLNGKNLTASWTKPDGKTHGGNATGQITNTDSQNRALRIEWSNGVIFFR